MSSGNESTSVGLSTARCSALSSAISPLVHERHAHLAVGHSLTRERRPHDIGRSGLVDPPAAAIGDLDLDAHSGRSSPAAAVACM